MFAGNLEGKLLYFRCGAVHKKCRITFLAAGNCVRIIVCVGGGAISDDPAGKALCDFIQIRDSVVDDQTSVHRKEICKLAEGMPDVRQVLKKIQVIFFNISDDSDFWEKA